MKPSDSQKPSTSPVRGSRFGGKTRKWLIRGAAAMVIYTVAGFFGIPALVKWQLQKQLPVATQRTAAVQQVKFNPYVLSLTINGLSLKETNGEPFASWEQFHVNFQLSSVFRWAWTFREIRLVEPRFSAVLGADGRFNFANLAAKTNATAKPTNEVASSALPRVIIYDLMITNGHVAFADLSLKTPFRTAYEPINLTLNNFTTKPDKNSPYAFNATSDSGRSLAWQGTVSANPAASAGMLRITGINLPRHAPYLEASTTAKVTGGTVDLSGDYSVAVSSNGLHLVVSNFSSSVTGLQIEDPDTKEVVFAMPKFSLRGGQLDWGQRRVDVQSIEIEEPNVLVRRRADGSINLLSLAVKNPPATATSNSVAMPAETNTIVPWVFSLANLRLANGKVAVEDLAIPGGFQSTLNPINLQVEHFSSAAESNTQVKVSILTESSESIDILASASVSPIEASGVVALTGIELKKYLAYARPFFSGRIPSGKLDISLPFSHSLTATQTHDVKLTNGMVLLKNLEIESPDEGEKWVQLPALALEGINVDLLEQFASIQSVSSTNVRIHVRREPTGALNLMSLLVSSNGGATSKVERATADTQIAKDREDSTNVVSASPPWRASVGEVTLSGWGLKLEDRALPKAAVVDVDQLSLSLRGVQFPSKTPVATELFARVNRAGTVWAHGAIRPYSAEVETEVEMEGLDLRAVQPWLQPHVRLTLTSGALSSKGRVSVAATNAPGPRIRFVGGLALTNFVTTDQVFSKEFVQWRELQFSGADVQLDPNQIEVEQIRMAGFRTAMIIGPDKKPNFVTIMARGTNNGAIATKPVPPPAASTGITNAPTPIRIAELKLENNSFYFQDQSIHPPAMFDFKEFGGTIRGLSTAAGSTAELDLAGRVDESAPFGIRGTMNPLSKDLWLDIAVTNQNLQLTPFTPYMEKFAGHPLNKGRLSLDLGYAIKEGKLKARNLVRIDQLTLGQRNNSPDATKLPVKLGIALLKDANGRIELDVPLEGRLNDPEFRVGPIILKVVMNLITKAAASPFKLLGGLVGGGEELSFVEFEPGLAAMLAGETNKLEKLSKALQQRPALNLEIEGGVDAVRDRDALAHAHVRRDLQQLLREEKTAAGETLDSGASIDVEAESERLLRVLASRQFGTNLAEALLQVQTNAPSTNFVARAPMKGPRLITYVTGLFSSKAERIRLAQARKQAREDEMLFKQNPALAVVTSSSLEDLLATKVIVSDDALRQLRLDRARVVQQALMESGAITADRLFLIEPKGPGAGAPAGKGEARVILTVN